MKMMKSIFYIGEYYQMYMYVCCYNAGCFGVLICNDKKCKQKWFSLLLL